tara:strand:+ start:821 stop:1171 length:351 start_codon:yes stop_codon:yes gene_type:complete
MCKIYNCFNESLTSDGYCLKHKNFTLTDYKVINDYIKKTIEKINPIDTKSRLKSFLRLNKYLMHRIDYIKSTNLINTMILKLESLYNKISVTLLCDEEMEEKLINLHINLCYLQDS